MNNFIELNVYYKGLKEIDDTDILLHDMYRYEAISRKIKNHKTNQITINTNDICYFEPTVIPEYETCDEMPLTKIVLKRRDCFFYIFTDMSYEELRDKVIVTKK